MSEFDDRELEREEGKEVFEDFLEVKPEEMAGDVPEGESNGETGDAPEEQPQEASIVSGDGEITETAARRERDGKRRRRRKANTRMFALSADAPKARPARCLSFPTISAFVTIVCTRPWIP